MNVRSIFFVFMLFFGVVFSIHILAPVDKEIKEGDTVYLGSIGPGQTIDIFIEEEVKTGGRFGQGGVFDYAIVEKAPPAWIGIPSKLHDKPLRVALTADPEAKEGGYIAKIKIIDENNVDGLGETTFFVKVNITYDIADVSITPIYVKTGPGQPAKFSITINNKGATGDVFIIQAQGPKRWEFKRSVFVPAKSQKTIIYEIVGNEEEVYKTEVSIHSSASPLIHYEKNITVDIQSNIVYDMKATNNGVLTFPIFESIVYSFFGLISNLLP